MTAGQQLVNVNRLSAVKLLSDGSRQTDVKYQMSNECQLWDNWQILDANQISGSNQMAVLKRTEECNGTCQIKRMSDANYIGF